MFEKERWALIVHGGAKQFEPGEEEENRRGCILAARAGAQVLQRGGSAIEAVEAAICVLEDLPVFNAGRGSAPNRDGEIEMCAGIMDGCTLGVGAVGALKGMRNPIRAARRLLGEDSIFLVGEGARRFAEAQGLDPASHAELMVEPAGEAHDTVGAVALDRGGNLAAGTSTGGLTGQPAGRVGDSPLPGSGFYADNHIAAVAFSGDGESIARLALAGRIMASLEDGEDFREALAKGLSKLPHVGGAKGDGGGIGISKDGTIAWWHNSPHFPVAVATAEAPEPEAWLKKEQE
jgi:L-asparaginase / beta-aspartyl-peptidase